MQSTGGESGMHCGSYKQNSTWRFNNEKINLKFILKDPRKTQLQGPSSFHTFGQEGPLRTAQPVTVHGETDFPLYGIGELAQEFASMSSATPPPSTSTSALVTSTRHSFNNIIATPTTEHIKSENTSFPSPFIWSWSTPFVGTNMFTTSGSNRPTCNFVNQNVINMPASIPSKTSAMPNIIYPVLNLNLPDSPPIRPRALRRHQYWRQVLIKKRRYHSSCRFCYNRYVFMCLDSHRPIPARNERGIWTGHKMTERGLVTCPHLWATTCSHCGATKQFAHIDDYCPFRAPML